MGDNSDKKIRVTYFFMRNPYMKFQNISIHDSKVMYAPESVTNERTNERTNVTNERTNERIERTNERTDKPEAICPPPTFFKVGGIKSVLQ